MSQAQLAQELASRRFPWVQQTAVRVESGSQPLKLEEAVAIAEILGVDMAKLYGSPRNAQRDAAALQLQISSANIARLRRQKAEIDRNLEDELTRKHDAERTVGETDAVQDADGNWMWFAEDGYARILPIEGGKPPRFDDENLERIRRARGEKGHAADD